MLVRSGVPASTITTTCMTLSRTTWTIALLTIIVTLAFTLIPQSALAQAAAGGTKDASQALQNPSGCWYNFQFARCVAVPVTLWASSAMLSMGGGILRFAGSIFDFGVNRAIMDFKNTLDSMSLVPIINSGWTFFRDIANILMIGIFVFIAISLILGLKEYGQKRMIARVLVIAVLMNFSLLFTKIVIDASNFMAYSIYSQTARVPNGGAVPQFSIADKILSPLHVTGVWDTSALALRVAQQTDGGAMKAFLFGLFGFFILSALALVILYGAFLIIARAIWFFILMLTAPIAYATYLSPHFEASRFGWTAWWKSLINNAAFAPLLMVFLSISILVMQEASLRVTGNDTFGALLNAPQQQVLADGWRVLFLYIIGTGMLFASFRLSSSLAGSISGVRAGQMAAGLPLIGGALLGAGLGQRTLGWNNARRAQNMNEGVDKAKRKAMETGLKSDWAAFDKLRKQKAELEKKADRSYNFMNTALGKAIAGSAGLKGVGETKGGFVSNMNAHAEHNEEKAKAMALTADDKAKMKKETEEEIAKQYGNEADSKAKAKEAAEKELEIARDSMQTAEKELAAASAQADSNRDARKGEVETVTKEVEAAHEEHQRDVNTRYDSVIAQHEHRSNDQTLAAAERQKAQQELVKARAEKQEALGKETQRIKEAHQKLTTINAEIDRPKTDAQTRLAAAQRTHAEKNTLVTKARKEANAVSSQMQRDIKEKLEARVKKAEEGVKSGISHLAEETSHHAQGGDVGKAIIEKSFTKYTKKDSPSSVFKDIQASLKSGGSSGTTT